MNRQHIHELDFSQARKIVRATVDAGITPLVWGHTGVGKTALMRDITDGPVITILGSLLKEGEIGGMPIATKSMSLTELFGDKVKEFLGKQTGMIRKDGTIPINTYTIHSKVLEVIAEASKNEEVLLFIDELNRADRETMNELFMLILDREVQGLKLPDNVIVAAANNLDDNTNGIDYGVNVMNGAFRARFNHFTLRVDVEKWLTWASENNLHPDVVGYIATYTSMLNAPHRDEMVWPNPRAWEMVSKLIKSMETTDPNDIRQLIAGVVGRSAADGFRKFMFDRENPILTPEEIFNYEKDPEVPSRVKSDVVPRLRVTAMNIVKHFRKMIDDGKKIKGTKEMKSYVWFIQNIQEDLAVSLIFDTAREDDVTHDMLTEDDEYLDYFFKLEEKIRKSNAIEE